jgi:hypothetical protein
MKVTLTLPAMRCVLLSLFLLGSLAGFAQPRWTFGLQGAGLYSIARRANHADVKDFYSQEHLPTASGGLVVQYRAGSRVQVESGLHLTGIGFRHVFSYTILGGMRRSLSSNQSFTYFRVPVHLRYALGTVSLPFFKMIQPYAVAGPSILFRTESAYRGMSHNNDWTASASTRPFLGVGVHLGLDLQKRMPRGDAFVTSLFSQVGLGRIVDSGWEYQANGTTYTGKTVNRGHFLAMGFAYLFRPYGLRRKSHS